MLWEQWEKGWWEIDNRFFFHIINNLWGKMRKTYEEHFLHRNFFMKSSQHLQKWWGSDTGQTASVQAPTPHSVLNRMVRELQNSFNNGLLPEIHQPLRADNQKLVLSSHLHALEYSLFWFSCLSDTRLPGTIGLKKYGSEILQDIRLHDMLFLEGKKKYRKPWEVDLAAFLKPTRLPDFCCCSTDISAGIIFIVNIWSGWRQWLLD